MNNDFTTSGRRAFLLEVAGLPMRYYSGAQPPSTAIPGVPSVYVDVEAVTNVSDYGATLDLAGGIAAFDTVFVTMASNQYDGQAPLTDPGVIFGRLGPQSSNAQGFLGATILQDDSLVGGIEMAPGSAVQFTAPGIIYIEQEAFYFTGISGDFLTGITRAVAGTHQQEHLVDTTTGSKPYVTDTMVFWRGQRAVLKMAPVRDDGSVGDYIEVAKGFIEQTPTIASVGTSVELGIAPLTAMLDVKYAGKSQAATVGLLEGWHYFVEGEADTVEILGAMYRGAVDFGLNPGEAATSQKLTVNQLLTSKYLKIFDPVGLNTPRHPRNGAMISRIYDDNVPYDVAGTTGVNQIDLTDANAPYSNLPLGSMVTNRLVFEAKRATCSPGLQEWPEAARTAFEKDFQPVDNTGRDGGWFTVRMADTVNGGPAIALKPMPYCADAHIVMTSRMSDYFSNTTFHWDGAASPYTPSHVLDQYQSLWFGLDLAKIDDTTYPRSDRDAPRERKVGWERRERVGSDTSVHPIRGVAKGYYQTGEQYILADGPVPILGGSTETHIEVEYFDRHEDDRVRARCRIISSTLVTHPTTFADVGYILEIDERDRRKMPCFGIWPGTNGAVTIKPVIVFDEDTASDVLLQLLMSGGGNHINDAGKPSDYPYYDVQTTGANLNYDDVNVSEVRAFTAPPRLNTWSLRVPDDATLGEIMAPVLTLTQTALTMQLDEDGKLKLTRVRIGPEDPTQVIDSIDAGEWDSDNLPRWGTDEAIKNVYKFQVNWDDMEDESKREIIVNDDRSIRSYAESQEINLDCRGLVLPDATPGTATQVLRGAYSLLSATFADPRRTFEGGISSGKGMLAQLGAIYDFSSPLLRSYGDTMGVTGAAGRIVEMRISLWNAEGFIKAVHYDSRFTGWNVALEIMNVSGADINIVKDAYGTTNQDLDHFSVGDTVRLHPAGNEDSITSHTVIAIDAGANKMTLNPAPPGTIVAPYYGDVIAEVRELAATEHKLLAFFAAATGLFGDGDDGQTFG